MAGMTLPAARDLARHGIRVLVRRAGPGRDADDDRTCRRTCRRRWRNRSRSRSAWPSRREVARLVQHMIENVMLNGEVVRLDGALRMPPK